MFGYEGGYVGGVQGGANWDRDAKAKSECNICL